jgi:hypothetical protein
LRKSVSLAPANRPSAASNQSSLCATIRHEAVFDPCPRSELEAEEFWVSSVKSRGSQSQSVPLAG